MNLIKIILAVDKEGNYGVDDCVTDCGFSMPWSRYVSKLSGDMKLFKKVTTGLASSTNRKNIVIMGKNTWRTLKKPLCNRYNIVVSKSMAGKTDVADTLFTSSLTEALLFISRKKILLNVGDIFIIGGKSLWSEALNRKIVSEIYLSTFNESHGDLKKFNIYSNKRFNKDFTKVETLLDNEYVVSVRYEVSVKEELLFLKTLEKIINKGVYRMDRSGVGTFSLFGKSFKYDIRNYRLPLFTHRKVFIRGIIEELLFFISGRTDTKELEAKGVNIWRGHTSREYLDKVGLSEMKDGSYGPSYGFQLRHWGADFKGDDVNYTGQGMDQLEYIVNLLKGKDSRYSRRLVFSYWNPSVLEKVPLPSCHVLYNFFVDPSTEELSVSFYQRSNDFALAAVFNVVSATILTFMLCSITGLKPGKCIHNIGDLHLYRNQINSVKEFSNNKANIAFCFMDIKNNSYSSLDEFKIEDFEAVLYNSRKKYNIPFSV